MKQKQAQKEHEERSSEEDRKKKEEELNQAALQVRGDDNPSLIVTIMIA